jgi:hypothetical protein
MQLRVERAATLTAAATATEARKELQRQTRADEQQRKTLLWASQQRDREVVLH